jgi:dTDP-4-dehydrorhamnose 3,5-epimerase
MNNDFLTDKVKEVLSTQSYEKSPRIDGVEMKELKQFVDDGGSFLELGRYSEGKLADFKEFEVKQVNFSQVQPGVIKAFHLHFNQDDIWFVPPQHRLLVVLTDCRKNSATSGETMRFVLGGGKSQLLFIPRGVAHGNATIGNEAVSMIYFVNQQFDAENPDEQRLPWDYLGKEIWEIIKG